MIERKEVAMELISLKGPHRIVRFSRGDGGGDGYWYRSETLFLRFFSGSTCSTLAEAERDFIDTILLNAPKEGG
jgi:hypothetical protein